MKPSGFGSVDWVQSFFDFIRVSVDEGESQLARVHAPLEEIIGRVGVQVASLPTEVFDDPSIDAFLQDELGDIDEWLGMAFVAAQQARVLSRIGRPRTFVFNTWRLPREQVVLLRRRHNIRTIALVVVLALERFEELREIRLPRRATLSQPHGASIEKDPIPIVAFVMGAVVRSK